MLVVRQRQNSIALASVVAFVGAIGWACSSSDQTLVQGGGGANGGVGGAAASSGAGGVSGAAGAAGVGGSAGAGTGGSAGTGAGTGGGGTGDDSGCEAGGGGCLADACTTIDGLLAARAQTLAPGMAQSGVVCGDVQQGSALSLEFSLLPGKCYTVIGEGLAGITQLDLVITAKPQPIPLPIPSPVLAASNTTQGVHPSIGEGSSCYKNPFPNNVPVTLTAKATKGSGRAGARVYVK